MVADGVDDEAERVEFEKLAKKIIDELPEDRNM